MGDIKPESEEIAVHDRDLRDEKPIQPQHIAELTEEEKVLEKKLVRRIDWIILPMIVTVYLLNWIDRYVMPRAVKYQLLRCYKIQKQLRISSSGRPRV